MLGRQEGRSIEDVVKGVLCHACVNMMPKTAEWQKVSLLPLCSNRRIYARQAAGASDLMGPSYPVGVVGAADDDADDDVTPAAGGVADTPSHYDVAVATR